jgi:predicted ATPase
MAGYRFTKIFVKNWKNFPKADVDLERRVFVVGRNAIGKTNFIDVFRFLRDLVLRGGGLSMAVHKRDGISNVRSRFSRENREVEVMTKVQDEAGNGWEYQIAFSESQSKDPRAPGGRGLAISKERLISLGAIQAKPLERDGKIWKLGGSQSFLENENATVEFSGFVNFLANTVYLHLVPQMIRENQGSLSDAIGVDPYGRGLLDEIKGTPKAEKKRRLKAIETVLAKVNPQFSELDQVEDKTSGRPHLQVKFKDWRNKGSRQDERQFSDGTLRLIGLLWALQVPGGAVLLEEPELSLNSGIAGQLAPFIAEVIRVSGDNRQVIVATHSEALMADEGIRPSEILLVQPGNKEGSIITQSTKIDQVNKQLRAGLLPSQVVLPLVYGEIAEPVFKVAEKAR